MRLQRVARRPVAFVTLYAFVSTLLLPITSAQAEERVADEYIARSGAETPSDDRNTASRDGVERPEVQQARPATMLSHAHSLAAFARAQEEPKERGLAQHLIPNAAKYLEGAALSEPPADAISVPTATMSASASTASSELSSSAIAMPQGAGTLGGMGESFTAQLSTGTGALSIPIPILKARGAAQPTLGLTYSSGAGAGVAGMGWSIGVPYIARQSDRGALRYVDPPAGTAWQPGQDTFVFNGAELVPICSVRGQSCEGALAGEVMPAWADGWDYFRPRLEGSFDRIFWSPDRRTWRVQTKAGTSLELGVPLDGSNDDNAIEYPEGGPANRIFRWNAVRYYDAHGEGNPAADPGPRPYNAVVYRYLKDAGVGYPSDIFDTPPVPAGAGAPLDAWAHHTHLEWESRADETVTFRRGWEVRQRLRLARVDVTSKPFVAAASSARRLVRRIYLGYDPGYRTSFLQSFQIEGRCTGEESTGGAPEGPDGRVGPTSCPRLPPVTLGYSHVKPSAPSTEDVPGFEPFDDAVHVMAGFLPTLGDGWTEPVDVNGDGIVDVLSTNAAANGSAHAVYLGGAGGPDHVGPPIKMIVSPGDGGRPIDAFSLSFKNTNVVSLDLDGDGLLNLVHMPALQTPVLFVPTVTPSGGVWKGTAARGDATLNPKLDLVGRRGDVRVADVNGDGLVDIVATSSTEVSTYFALGRYPGGAGRFGSVSFTSTGPVLSASPYTACLPYSSGFVRFGQSDVKLADMNGDGLIDIVRVRKGDIRYWPGRGDGTWGTGDLSACRASAVLDNRAVVMTLSPFWSVDDATIALSDVSGDGLADIIQIRPDAVDVWRNVVGTGWVDRRSIRGPSVPVARTKIRVLDVNGSGTADVLWGEAGAYRYVDLLGGARPGLLTEIDNGVGKTTEIEYATSTSEMLASAGAGKPWATTMPLVAHVVKRTTTRDNLEKVGRPGGKIVTEYAYRDPVYDGARREFRGFRTATETHVGDANIETSVTVTSFHLGECTDETGQPCATVDGDIDNLREGLKGLPRLIETSDTVGTTLTTSHSTYRVRTLYEGLNGRRVQHTFAEGEDVYQYDTSSLDHTASTVSLPEVVRESIAGAVVEEPRSPIILGGTAGRVRLRKTHVVDGFGNATASTAYGCVEGCSVVDEQIRTWTIPGRNADDASGWMWRTVESYVVGSNNPGDTRQRTITDFDARGRPYRVRAELRGTLPLDRAHEAGGDVAPPPVGASKDGSLTLSEVTFDDYGNVTATRAPGGRCSSSVLDPTYADLIVVDTVFAGTTGSDGCGTTVLATTGTYDRGLAVIRSATGYNGELSRADYDGFGRVVALWAPDPTRLGATAPLPAQKFEYILPESSAAPPLSIIHTQVQDGPTPDVDSYAHAWSFVDAFGRDLITLHQADPAAGDDGEWVATGLTDYNAKGSPWRVFRPWFWSGSPLSFDFATTPSALFATQSFDAFGRPTQSIGPDGKIRLLKKHRPLQEEIWDAEDLSNGPHAGTFSSLRADGHGRTIAQTERVRVNGVIEEHTLRTEYLPTGEPTVLTRTSSAPGMEPVVRWMRYDSLGRRVLSVEPSTAGTFNPDPAADPSTVRGLRYAYDDNGDLVGTSDGRGCGVNYHYDAAGRLLAEDVSPCTQAQDPYSPPDLVTGAGTETFVRYDAPFTPALSAMEAQGCSVRTDNLRGGSVSVASRGSESAITMDARGRTVCSARRIAKPGSPATELSARYSDRWFVKQATFDAADRVVTSSTGAQSQELLADGKSTVSLRYAKRGVPFAVDSSYGSLIARMPRDADGRPISVTYGDAARTTTTYEYDARHRLRTVQTFRARPSLWSGPSGSYSPPPSNVTSTLQLLLEDADFTYDDADNPIEINDHRSPDEWPSGAKPVSRSLAYDDLYRVTKVTYRYAAGDERWVSPYAAEDNASPADATKRPRPSPRVSFDTRVREESFTYDWLGNVITSADDARGFYDRSLGTMSYGMDPSGAYQLRRASNRGGTTTKTREGDLDARYDGSGNLIELIVRRDGPCMPSGASCWQRYAYDWDELGHLSVAKRWDLVGDEHSTEGALGSALPTRRADVELHYAYDSTDARVRKTAVDGNGLESHTLYVFDSLDIRGSRWVGAPNSGEYTVDPTTEVPYLLAEGARLARVVYADADVPALASGRRHVFLELPDHLGSTAIVIDRDTSELVERGTYTAYGGTESNYRPERWNAFREDYRFTGKEEDIEVGLQYFGKRYFSPQLARWVSPDPLSLNGLAGDANVYAYVHGRTFATADPDGQCELICMMLIGAAVSVAITAGTRYLNNQPVTWQIVGIAAIAGATGGAFAFAAAPLGATLATATGISTELGSAVVAGGSAGLGSGLVNRGAQRGDVGEVLGNMFDPVAVATDVGWGAAGGAVMYQAETLAGGLGRSMGSTTGERAAAATGTPAPAGPAPAGAGPTGAPVPPAATPVAESPATAAAKPAPSAPEPVAAKPAARPSAPKPAAPASAPRMPTQQTSTCIGSAEVCGLNSSAAANGGDSVAASTPVGRVARGPMTVQTPGTNGPATIGGRTYTGHALDRMQQRGLVPSVVEDTIANGSATPGRVPGTTAHYSTENNVTIITDSASGRVITTYPGSGRGF